MTTHSTVTLPDGSTVSASNDLLARAALAVDLSAGGIGNAKAEEACRALLLRCADVRKERRAGRDGLAIAEAIVAGIPALPRGLAQQVQTKLSQCIAASPLNR